MSTELKHRIASAALIIGFFLLWEFVCWAFKISSIVLPRPSEILVTLVEHVLASMPGESYGTRPAPAAPPLV